MTDIVVRLRYNDFGGIKMTEIVFKYNPIQVRADITIEGNEVAKTSNLYRYRNTPLEDWIDVMIPELVDYCNDDNIRIEIRSLQKYIDEINKAIRTYEKNHRHVDIEVSQTPSTGYKGRLNKISQIIELVKEAEVDLTITDDYPLDVFVVSMADEDEYEEMLGMIFPDIDAKSGQAILITKQEYEEDGFETKIYGLNDLEDRHVDARVLIFPSLNECSNKYWRLLKEKINGDRDYILIALLNSKPKKNDELFDYVAEQLEKKGKINKSRFVFISENPEDNLEYIQDQYGVKLNDILDYDNADEVLEKIMSYIQNVCYVRKIAELSECLKNHFELLQERISREAEKNKDVDELDRIMQAYRNVMDSINNHYGSISCVESGSFSPENATAEFIELLTNNITDLVVEDAIKVRSNDEFGYLGSAIHRGLVKVSFVAESYDLYDKFRSRSKEGDIMALTESTFSDFLINFFSEHILLQARNETELTNGFVLKKTYPILPLIKDNVQEICQKSVRKIARIEKKNESGRKIGFFSWVTENISQYDFEYYLRSRSHLDYENSDYSEISKKIKRRIKTIEADIESIFAMAFKQLGFDKGASILKQRIQNIESMTNASIKRLEEKCSEAIDQMEISSEDKCRITNIENLLKELEEVINL